MPKITPYYKISNNIYEFDSKIFISGYDAKLQVPKRLANTVGDKKVKVIIEVIEK
ncbi:MAG: hypothetical protein ACOC56_05765 [Atribacterota bacterium]